MLHGSIIFSSLLFIVSVCGDYTKDISSLSSDCQCHIQFSSDPYHSRIPWDDEVSLCPRTSPVVWNYQDAPLSDGLTEAQLRFYDQYGYLVFPSLLPIDYIENLLKNVSESYLPDVRDRDDLLVMEKNGKDIRSVFEYHKHPTFQELISDPRILNKVEQILGSRAYIHQSRINFQKAFSGQGFSWHSDFETWHCEDGMEQPRALSAVVMLDDTFAFNGALMVVPGSHKTYVVCRGETPEKHWEESLVDQKYGGPTAQQLKCLFNDATHLTADSNYENTCESSSSTPASLRPNHGVQYVEGLAGTVFFLRF